MDKHKTHPSASRFSIRVDGGQGIDLGKARELTLFMAAILACRLPRASSFCFSSTSAAAPAATPFPEGPPPLFQRSLIFLAESSQKRPSYRLHTARPAASYTNPLIPAFALTLVLSGPEDITVGGNRVGEVCANVGDREGTMP